MINPLKSGDKHENSIILFKYLRFFMIFGILPGKKRLFLYKPLFLWILFASCAKIVQ